MQTVLKIVVNMISLFQGGAKTVGLGLLEGIACGNFANVKWTIILPSNVGFEEYVNKFSPRSDISLIFVSYPTRRFRFLSKLYLDHFYTSFVFFHTRSSVLFMTANFASLFVRGTQQVVLQHNVHYLMDGNPFALIGFKNSLKYRLEKFLFYVTTLVSARYVVQLECNKHLLGLRYKVPRGSIDVVTMVPLRDSNKYIHRTQQIDEITVLDQINVINQQADKLKLFFPAKLYPNKNHQILFQLARYIQKMELSVVVFITVEPDSSFMTSVRAQGCGAQIINLGYIQHEEIQQVYSSVDGLFFPTFSESYGLPYVEALLAGIPIITSDYDFSREVCGAGAIYFDQNDLNSLFRTLELFVNSDFRNALKVRAIEQSKKYSHSWDFVINEIFRFGCDKSLSYASRNFEEV